jgi:hypothetical protein
LWVVVHVPGWCDCDWLYVLWTHAQPMESVPLVQRGHLKPNLEKCHHFQKEVMFCLQDSVMP